MLPLQKVPFNIPSAYLNCPPWWLLGVTADSETPFRLVRVRHWSCFPSHKGFVGKRAPSGTEPPTCRENSN